jgi:hypothetical protein
LAATLAAIDLSAWFSAAIEISYMWDS